MVPKWDTCLDTVTVFRSFALKSTVTAPFPPSCRLRASFPHYKLFIQDHQIALRTFYFMSNFAMDCEWIGICPISRSSEARWKGSSFSSTCANTYQHSTRLQGNLSANDMALWIVNSLLTWAMRTDCSWTLIQKSLNLWTAEAVSNRASELWKSLQIPKMTVHKKCTHKIKSSQLKFDDLGVIIMRKRCSIQQGEKSITVDQ